MEKKLKKLALGLGGLLVGGVAGSLALDGISNFVTGDYLWAGVELALAFPFGEVSKNLFSNFFKQLDMSEDSMLMQIN